MIRRFHHSEFDARRLLEHKAEPVAVVLPAREVADTIGAIVERLGSLDPLIDQIVVVDAASEDGTAEVAAAAGAEVHQESELVPELGPALGKGDAMWRALEVVRAELVVYLDSDTRDFSPHFLAARPLLSAFYPELAAFVQPLAGEVAARRSLLERLQVVLARLRAEGRLTDDAAAPLQTADGRLVQVELVERPPIATLPARA